MTSLLYLTDQTLKQAKAKVVAADTLDDSRIRVILDQTVFYPQGGGQPFDQGRILGQNFAMAVDEVRFVDGLVHHTGLAAGMAMPGMDVDLFIDAERRLLHSRLHTAGHLIDEAVIGLGLPWTATKGNHIPGQSSVEFEGAFDEAANYAAIISNRLQDMIATDFKTRTMLLPREGLYNLAHNVPDNMPSDKPFRLVIVWGDKGHPCGGTHVSSISEVGKILIAKVKVKRRAIKVSYDIA